MEDKKAPPIEMGGEEAVDVMPAEQDFYYMKCALIHHYKKKYPEQEALVTEICEMVGKLIGAKEPQGANAFGGGVGMVRGWVDYLLENESKTKPPS